ncbi:hypothetical protein CANCADRAFT_2726 [Tortispora caseinolytica NRRL Y-17796]|uniref:Phosphoribosylglycinamide formyltransferase n=1 Tax=Tortispora caseinolytica NRRL Y-17796 TaxID=767744 RepID=A0A1E4TGX7_9ASCO|nr:hypothetical protein CANCADRAFT_2726 [Tortispora caseinolytica NRRL Y-17796]
MKNVLVMISGSGTNLQALIDASKSGSLPIKVFHVISSSSTAYGLQRAANANIPTTVHELQTYYKDLTDKDKRKAARKQFNIDLGNIIVNLKPDLIVCAGWMLILSPSFLDIISEKNIPIINLHPALPGQFDGINAIERAYNAAKNGEIQKSGVMIHQVIKEVDRGTPLVVKEVPILPDDTLESFESRIHSVEHEAIVEGVRLAISTLCT